MSNLAVRVVVALVGIPLILLAALAGGYVFFVLVALVSTVALLEFYGLARIKGAAPLTLSGVLLGLLVNALFIFERLKYAVVERLDAAGLSVSTPTMSQALLMVLLFCIPLLMCIELFRNRGSAILNLAATLFGVGYVSLFLGSLVGLRELFVPGDFPVYAHFSVVGTAVSDEIAATVDRWGAHTIIALFASVWACDSAAYFVGRGIGRHRLFKRVSPKKTWEGAVAGFGAAVGAFVLVRALALPYMSLSQALVCGSIIGLFGQVGDLAESLLKRDAGVKDSSAIIPGHGGMLDRFDSILFVSPLLYLYLDFIVF